MKSFLLGKQGYHNVLSLEKRGLKLARTVIVFIFSIIFSGLCFADGLTVAVASNAQYVFEELKMVFETTEKIPLKGVIGSSGKIVSQIEQGAPFDLFLSADMEYPQGLYHKGLAPRRPEVYAYGTLVLWTGKKMDLSAGLNILKSPLIQKIALPNPKISPYGRQAVQVLKQEGLYEEVNKKIVYGESVAQVNQFITLKAVDIGFTAKSVVRSPRMINQGWWMEIDPETYEPIAQGVVILQHAQEHNLLAAEKFYAFLFSSRAREIYQKHGYVLP